ncbi:MAG: hypothetical protein AB1725_03800 [Armatimonadota bacterium]
MKRNIRGSSSVVTLYVMMVVTFSVLSLAGLTITSLNRARGEVRAAEAFHAAQASAEYVYQKQRELLEVTRGEFEQAEYDLHDVPLDVPDGMTGRIEVAPSGDGSSAWITAEVFYGNQSRSVRLLAKAKDVGVWNNAVFAGAGASGKAINGNVDIRGSVHLLGDGEPYTDLNGNGKRDDAELYTDLNFNGQWDPGEPFIDANGDGVWNPAEPYQDANNNGIYDPPLTVTELNSSFSGNAFIGNNYVGISFELESQIPQIPLIGGLKSLGAEVRVKHGRIKVQGSARIGEEFNNGINKGKVEGTFVNDGWTGSPGAGGVFSDNGTNNGYDLDDLVPFPYINGLGAQPYYDPITGTTYSTHEQFLNDRSLTINLPSFDTSMDSFQFGPDANGNMMRWDKPSGVLTVEGIVKVNGNVSFGKKNQTIRFDGRGTIFATGSIDVHSNLLPRTGRTFPIDAALGFIAARDINLATGPGDAQLKMMGAFYAQGIIRSAKQNQIAGTFVGSYYDMGTNVPNIYQVPELAGNLPPGMPGDKPIISLKRKTWRERIPTDG